MVSQLTWTHTYLSHNGVKVVLLNRPGLSGDVDGIGYVNGGYHVSLLDGGSGGNIDNAGSYSDSSQVSGAYYASQGSAAFGGYNASSPSGNWVLFVSDLSGGDISTLTSWSLTIDAVPEPVDVALGIFLAIMVVILVVRRRDYFRQLAARMNTWINAV